MRFATSWLRRPLNTLAQGRDPAAFQRLLTQRLLDIPPAYSTGSTHHANAALTQAMETSCLAQWFVMVRLEVPLEIAVTARGDLGAQVSLVITFTSTAEVWVIDVGLTDQVDQLGMQAAVRKKQELADRGGDILEQIRRRGEGCSTIHGHVHRTVNQGWFYTTT